MEPGVSYLEQLPPEVREVIRSQLVVQCATVSAAGVPIDSPTAVFTSVDLSTLDFTTGLAYPAKAERARNNPKVGLLFDGEADTPVVSIAGMAAVRDDQLQANLERYLAETALVSGKTAMSDWSINRHAVWYYARVFVCINPVHIRWWPNHAAMDESPHLWQSPTHSFQPASDAAPASPERRNRLPPRCIAHSGADESDYFAFCQSSRRTPSGSVQNSSCPFGVATLVSA